MKLYKRYRNRLWRQDGDGSENPLGQRDVEEHVESIHVTAADGSFDIHCNPSTRPKEQFAGRTEPYEIIARLGDGRGAYARRVVARGEIVDLGDLVVR